MVVTGSDYKCVFGKHTYRTWCVFCGTLSSDFGDSAGRKWRSPGVFTEGSLIPNLCSAQLFPSPCQIRLAAKDGKRAGKEAGNGETNLSQPVRAGHSPGQEASRLPV